MDNYQCNSNLIEIEDDSITMKELSNSIEEIGNPSDIYLIFKPPPIYDFIKTQNAVYSTNHAIFNEIVNNKIEFMSSRNSPQQTSATLDLDDDVSMKQEFNITNNNVHQTTKTLLDTNLHTSKHKNEIFLRKNKYFLDTNLHTSKHKNEIFLRKNTTKQEMVTPMNIQSKLIKKNNKNYSNLIKMYCTKCDKVSTNNYETKCGDCQTLLLFQCITCNCHYRKLISIHNHIKYECFKGTVFYCNECNFESIYKLQLIKHIQNEHSDLISVKIFTCSVCQKKFKNQQNVLSHERVCCNEPVLKCKSCPFKTKYGCILTKHVILKHQKVEKKLYHCRDCGKKYDSLRNLNRHIIKFCGKSLVFKCDHCDYKINRKFSLAKHIQENHSELFSRSKFLRGL